jgi:hypothetical protein
LPEANDWVVISSKVFVQSNGMLLQKCPPGRPFFYGLRFIQ